MSVIAFRRWRVDCTTLYGVGVPVTWQPGPQTAECHGWFAGNTCTAALPAGHPAPSLGSRCGIWAHKQPIAPCQCPTPTTAVHGAVGAVRLWGRYVEHETGWRAQHAQLVALVDYTGHVDPAYDAPRYPDLESLYAEWAPDAAGSAPGEPECWCVSPAAAWVQATALAMQKAAAAAVAELAAAFQRSGLNNVGRLPADQNQQLIPDSVWRHAYPPDQQTEQRRAELLAQQRARHQHGPWLDQPERRRRRP